MMILFKSLTRKEKKRQNKTDVYQTRDEFSMDWQTFSSINVLTGRFSSLTITTEREEEQGSTSVTDFSFHRWEWETERKQMLGSFVFIQNEWQWIWTRFGIITEFSSFSSHLLVDWFLLDFHGVMERWSLNLKNKIQHYPIQKWVRNCRIFLVVVFQFVRSGWIGSIGQSFGGLIAPTILLLTRRFGYQYTFILSSTICFVSLLFSSFLRNLHWLLLLYSFPYGFANTAIYLLGTLICGLYFPVSEHRRHVFVMCIISTGFPIGYHVMSAFVFSFIENAGWQSMKRRIGLMEFFATCILGPLFTTKFLPAVTIDEERPSTIEMSKSNRKIYYSIPVICWMFGIFTAMCSINNFLLHLVSVVVFPSAWRHSFWRMLSFSLRKLNHHELIHMKTTSDRFNDRFPFSA